MPATLVLPGPYHDFEPYWTDVTPPTVHRDPTTGPYKQTFDWSVKSPSTYRQIKRIHVARRELDFDIHGEVVQRACKALAAVKHKKYEQWLHDQELVKMAMEQCKHENEVAQLKEEKRLRMQAYHMRKRNEKAMGKKVKPRELWAQRVLQPLPES